MYLPQVCVFTDDLRMNETFYSRSMVMFSKNHLACYGPFQNNGLTSRFKAIRIQCGISRYRLDVEEKASVKWYYRTESNNVRVYGKVRSDSAIDTPFQRKRADGSSTSTVWKDLYIPEKALAARKWTGMYICLAADERGNELEVRRVLVQGVVRKTTK